MNKGVRILYYFMIVVLVAGCSWEIKDDQKTQAKKEILEAEKAFQQMLRKKGIREAFLFYADDNATIIRGEQLIKGRDAIKAWYDKSPGTGMDLFWTPEYVDASASGDLGYTYGQYRFVITDSTGARKEGKGIFHTVWKKLPDGTWKFVWD